MPVRTTHLNPSLSAVDSAYSGDSGYGSSSLAPRAPLNAHDLFGNEGSKYFACSAPSRRLTQASNDININSDFDSGLTTTSASTHLKKPKLTKKEIRQARLEKRRKSALTSAKSQLSSALSDFNSSNPSIADIGTLKDRANCYQGALGRFRRHTSAWDTEGSSITPQVYSDLPSAVSSVMSTLTMTGGDEDSVMSAVEGLRARLYTDYPRRGVGMPEFDGLINAAGYTGRASSRVPSCVSGGSERDLTSSATSRVSTGR